MDLLPLLPPIFRQYFVVRRRTDPVDPMNFLVPLIYYPLMRYPFFAIPYPVLCRYVHNRFPSLFCQDECVFFKTSKDCHLTNLSLGVCYVFHLFVVDGRCHFFIHVSPFPERLNEIALPCYPRQHAGFNRRVVGEHQSMAVVGYQHRTQQVGRQNRSGSMLRHILIRFEFGDDLVQLVLFLLRTWEVLWLHQLARPAASCSAMINEQTAHPSVGVDRVQHRVVLGCAGLGSVLPKRKNFADHRVQFVGGQQPSNGLLVNRLGGNPVAVKPSN